MEAKGFTVWFTGMSASGKTTLALLVEQELRARQLRVERLDGDVMRRLLTPDLGYNMPDRWKNVQRVTFVAQLLVRNHVTVLCALISPLRQMRDAARREIGRFVEVHCRCPLDVLIERDSRGLYAQALRGEISEFTGISSTYEEPQSPEVLLDTHLETPQQSARKVILTLEKLGYIPALTQEGVYTPEEEQEIEERLHSLGYL